MTINQRKTRVLLLLGGVSFVTLVSAQQFMTTSNSQPDSTTSPHEFDTQGTVPGNPANAAQDLQQIYKMIGTYKSRPGSYPDSTARLTRDVIKEPEAYGYSKPAHRWELPDAFVNPDTAYTGAKAQPRVVKVPYRITNKRPDGTSIESINLPGQKDVLAYTDIYIHRNIHRLLESKTTENPVGFYVVLWDDGTVTQVPYDQLLYIPEVGNTPIRGRFKHAFSGQDGVPADAITYDQLYKKVGWKKGPRGKEGGPGLSYDTYK